jgi:para-nitrobenzyl esterase
VIRISLLLPFLATLTVVCPLPAIERPAPSVRVDGGLVSGLLLGTGGEIRAYKGIPFAAPPVGALRWRPPQPVRPWEGVRACTRVGPACPQPKQIVFGNEIFKQDEDCLYLNVWTPVKDTRTKQPVMFWIHGGGFTTGTGGLRVYDGESLARNGVVVVTINYRLGPLGFMAHPQLTKESEHGSSGNYGLLDQIHALKWVQRNIGAFGGDPTRVMIFGESAGAVSVAQLMISPLAKGLFHRALAQSGGPSGHARKLKERSGRLESAEAMGVRLAGLLGCESAPDTLAALRAKSPDEILKVADPAQGLFGKGMKFGPVVDGWVLPNDPLQMWDEGKQHPVPFIAGSNADEATIFLRQLPIQRALGYKLIVRTMFGSHAQEILRLFPAERDEDVRQALNKLTTVSAFTCPARLMVRSIERIEKPSRLYFFSRVPDFAKPMDLGAFHGLEIAYVFGNVRQGVTLDGVDRKLSESMRAYWVNFARNGNPNGPGLTDWPIYNTAKDQYIEFGDKIKVKAGLYREACDVLDKVRRARGRAR